nr:tRNA (adenosine(37)-N6)-dimethylallyltransferase MiaA [Opitutaceae bacterium]
RMCLAAALAELRRLNPAGLAEWDVANPRRVTRAFERCLAAGRTMAELAADFARQAPAFAEWEMKLTRLERPADELAERIQLRVAVMLESGLVEEVRQLLAQGLAENPSAARAIGYREVIAMLAGELPQVELAGAISQNTRALVRKQRTWFRTQLPPHREVSPDGLTLDQLFGG